MGKHTTTAPSEFDADERFKKAHKMMMKYLRKNEADGPMAMISLARALGGTLMLITEKEQRDIALVTVISEMCKTFSDFLLLEAEDDE